MKNTELIRFTETAPEGGISLVSGRTASDALARLAVYEDLLEALLAAQDAIPGDLEQLKAVGKEKSVRYKELLGEKLLNNHAVALFRNHGLL